MKHKTSVLSILIFVFLFFSCSGENHQKQADSDVSNQLNNNQQARNDHQVQVLENQNKYSHPLSDLRDENVSNIKTSNPKITFVELGSVKCIPCKAMQPVMKSIEKKYGEQIRVVFYDVWMPEEQKYGKKYGIRVIPTQVFLDENGNEIKRHEGFFPEAEIDAFLAEQGLKIEDPR